MACQWATSADAARDAAERRRLRPMPGLGSQLRVVGPGTHITAMGSDDHGKQELDAATLGKADLVVADSRSQCVDHGECRAAVVEGWIQEDAIVELGTVIEDPARGRTGADQITVADLTGVAVQDIQIAKMVARAVGL